MKFYEIVEKLQKEEKNKGYIVFIRCGIFYTGIGKDAVMLSEKYGLTPICIKENICKCGVPVNSFSKFMKKLIENKDSFVVYDYNKENEEKCVEILRVTENKNYEERKCLNCEKCWYKKNKTIITIEESLKQIENMQKQIKDKNER